MGEFLRVALAVAEKDLRLELRTRATILSAVVFAALVLVVFNFSRDPTAVHRGKSSSSAQYRHIQRTIG